SVVEVRNGLTFLDLIAIQIKIPPLVGPDLNKAGNFPTLVNHQESLEAKVNETKATVKFLLWKFKRMLAHPFLDHWDEEDYEYDEEEEGIQSTEHLQNGSSFLLHQQCYFLPPKIEGEFVISDLVWGKVRSYLWWPDGPTYAASVRQIQTCTLFMLGDELLSINGVDVKGKPVLKHCH
nr:putative 60S ribosomal protein L10A [Tanacetum cinerariifolium]